MKVLLTGFEPFDDLDYNPSQMLIEYFKKYYTEKDIFFEILPVTRGASNIYRDILSCLSPDYIINLGLSNKSINIQLEKIALNIIDYKGKADNDGNILSFSRIYNLCPDALLSDINLNLLKDKLIDYGIPASVSYHAGTFICNMIYYESCLYYYKKNLSKKCLFVHIPFDSEYAESVKENLISIKKDKIIDAVKLIIET